MNDFPKTLPIKKIIKENDTTNTYVFEHSLDSQPGQFVNLWLPGIDENPFSIAWDNGKEFALTICKVGDMTEKLFELKEGDKVGIRGPYGTHYHIEPGTTIATVAGGYGAAPMYYAATEAIKQGCKVEFIVGARNKDLLLFIERAENLDNVDVHIATDDGSVGHKGYNVEILQRLVEGGNIRQIFACGPELMLKAVSSLGAEYNIDTQLSMERYMKCGIGVCGNCVVDDLGICMCKEGPVISNDLAQQIKEFGKYHRDRVGKKHFY